MGHSTLKGGVCDSPLFLGPQESKIPDGAQDLTILTCSEIKTPKQNPFTKVSVLISDIINMWISFILIVNNKNLCLNVVTKILIF